MEHLDVNKQYRNILILESRKWWKDCENEFDPKRDLVLTYDFGLKHDVEKMGGQALYIDHLMSKNIMQEYNFQVYNFFKKWWLDKKGNDIFIYKGISFGSAFRMEIWNDYIFYVRNRICLDQLIELKYENLFAGISIGIVEKILKEMSLTFKPITYYSSDRLSYFFQIFQWMDEKLRIRTMKHRFRDLVTRILGIIMGRVDQFMAANKKKNIYLQEYYPTISILQKLKKNNRIRLILTHFSWDGGWLKYLTERPIPIRKNTIHFRDHADNLMLSFQKKRCSKLKLANKVDITDSVYEIIEERVSKQITDTICALDSVIHFINHNPIKLAILIANLGKVATMVDCVCRAQNIPTYLIINGFMTGDFLDESKQATFINAYSISIKENYFRGMDNIKCLGDPRMDSYVKNVIPQRINRENPTITIGTSAFNPTDLNSYLAVEFEFMHDVLRAINIFRKKGAKIDIIIKVRANGYQNQYRQFIGEYFPNINYEIVQSTPMQDVLKKTDLYISFYSQTLIEASCLGIPSIYYKKDIEIIDPPFDGNSELVTPMNFQELVDSISDFFTSHKRFDSFLNKRVLEKYIGKLDGENLKRNLNFIYSLINHSPEKKIKNNLKTKYPDT